MPESIKKYKIAFIGRFDSLSVGEPDIARALESLGHSVFRFDENLVKLRTLTESLRVGKFDFLLYTKLRIASDHEVMEFLKSVKIPKICWIFDLYFGLPKREAQLKLLPIFRYSDVVFTTDGGHQKEFEALGINHVCLRQGVDITESYISKDPYPTKAEIGFVGSINIFIWKYRESLILWLQKTYGDSFVHVGQNGKVRHKELNNFLASTKLIVGDSVQSDYYWSNRPYEIIGRGGVYIGPRIKGFDDEFKPFEHYIPYTFGDFGELQDVIQYYLENDEEREKIRVSGLAHCQKYHTYTIRVQKLLDILNEKHLI